MSVMIYRCHMTLECYNGIFNGKRIEIIDNVAARDMPNPNYVFAMVMTIALVSILEFCVN